MASRETQGPDFPRLTDAARRRRREVVMSTLDRRRFVRVAVLAGAAMLGLEEAAAAADASDAVVGSVVSANQFELVLKTSDGRVTVVPTAQAKMYCGASGGVSNPSVFRTGDRVAAQGSMSGSAFDASFVGSVYTRIDAVIDDVSADGRVAHTTIGDIDLVDGQLPFTSASEQSALRPSRKLSPGATITGLGWRDPETDETFLLVGG
jgi:hypothetical protein